MVCLLVIIDSNLFHVVDRSSSSWY